jgi:hypothetical protein
MISLDSASAEFGSNMASPPQPHIVCMYKLSHSEGGCNKNNAAELILELILREDGLWPIRSSMQSGLIALFCSIILFHNFYT